MRKYSRKWIVMLTMLAAFSHGNVTVCAEIIHLSAIKMLYPQADGAFVLIFNVDSASCNSPQSPKYYYVTVGQNGVNAEGSKKIYATAMLAMAMNKQVNIAFDNASLLSKIAETALVVP